jgi:hypothetical protein
MKIGHPVHSLCSHKSIITNFKIYFCTLCYLILLRNVNMQSKVQGLCYQRQTHIPKYTALFENQVQAEILSMLTVMLSTCQHTSNHNYFSVSCEKRSCESLWPDDRPQQDH